MVKWLKRRDRDRHGLGSKPSRDFWLCPWERGLTALFPVWWWSWQAAQIKVISLLKISSGPQYLGNSKSRTEIFACLMYSLRCFPAGQEDKYRDKNKKSFCHSGVMILFKLALVTVKLNHGNLYQSCGVGRFKIRLRLLEFLRCRLQL